MFKLPGLVFSVTVLLVTGIARGDSYETHVRPFLTRYCVSCHGPDVQKAKLRLDTLDPDMIRGSDTDMWQEVLDLLNVSEMPPQKAKRQPTPAERQVVVAALTSSIRQGRFGISGRDMTTPVQETFGLGRMRRKNKRCALGFSQQRKTFETTRQTQDLKGVGVASKRAHYGRNQIVTGN